MRSALAELVRSSASVIRHVAVLILGALASLVAMAGTAAAEQAARVEPNTVTFGLLGPVGLAAVVLGIVGMAAGVLCQRRRVRATEPAADGGEVGAVVDVVGDQAPALAGTVLTDAPARADLATASPRTPAV